MPHKVIPERTGIAKQTLHTIGSRDDYNATLELIEELCLALDVPIQEMLPDPPKGERTARKKRRS